MGIAQSPVHKHPNVFHGIPSTVEQARRYEKIKKIHPSSFQAEN